MVTRDAAASAAASWWQALEGRAEELEQLSIAGPRHVLPSVYDVTGIAAAAIGVATLAVAELAAARHGRSPADVSVDRREASAAFRSEAILAPSGWTLPPAWDPIAGDYRAADGWVRLHTNYGHHRAAALRALELPTTGTDRAAVAGVVAQLPAREVQERAVSAGGCAAAMHTARSWAEHPHGRAVRGRAAVALHRHAAAAEADDALRMPARGEPLAGIRVLDLTRVIAGPVCTRTLAAWGADVLRIDPPGFTEVPALLPDTTAGKRCAALDLSAATDRSRFEALVRAAHVLVHGLRPGALERLGYGGDSLRAINPALVTAAVDAYGPRGPWARRRGFDSLVQMSCGIAAAASLARRRDAAGPDGPRPVPLPAQALDHGSGYLLAAAVCRSLTTLLRTGRPADARASLVGVAAALMTRKVPGGLDADAPVWTDADTVPARTAWGPARMAPCPGRIDGQRGGWSIDAGPLGRHDAAF